MKIEEFDSATQLVGEQIKLPRRQTALFPRRLWAKNAIKIAYIRYFEITACNHSFFIMQATPAMPEKAITSDS
jgi:hypothetical protein